MPSTCIRDTIGAMKLRLAGDRPESDSVAFSLPKLPEPGQAGHSAAAPRPGAAARDARAGRMPVAGIALIAAAAVGP